MKGISWFLLSLLLGCLNDCLQKTLGQQSLPAMEVAFLRFAFSLITMIPVVCYYGRTHLKTSCLSVHLARGSLLFLAIACWCYGITFVPLSQATVLNFTIPLFTLLLAAIFLKEKVNQSRWLATGLGFIGVLLVLQPTWGQFDYNAIIILGASFLFASLDVLNKRFVMQETFLSMVFYSALFSTVLGFYPAIIVWVAPSAQQLWVCLLLGACANFLLYCLLKAFSYLDASVIAPFRYLELLASALLGYIVFAEVPGVKVLCGALVIIPCTLYVIYDDAQKDSQSTSDPESIANSTI